MKKLVFLFALPFLLAGCNDDDDNGVTPVSTNFTVTIKNVAQEKSFIESGVFNTPEGDAEPGPAAPGKEYQFTFNAGLHHRLSFVTMLAATNDLFFAPEGEGIALYDENGDPISGDVTDQVYLWDAGTEVNEEPWVGDNTVTQQDEDDMGEDENGNVMKIENVTTGFDFNYPDVSEFIEVTITHLDGTEFQASIEVDINSHLSTSAGDKDAPISPGVWVVHGGDNPLFTEGEPDRDQGLEAIAEDGKPATLGAYVEENTGVTFPISPGVWVVHDDGTSPLFSDGTDDYGEGLENIAEDGNATILGGIINSKEEVSEGAVFNTPEGGAAGPLLPGNTYEFSFEANVDDNLSFVSMLAATNDVFLGTPDGGLALFDSNGEPISGNITGQLYWWDAGTEVNEQPAVGPNTVTNQAAENTGPDEEEPVRLLSEVDDGYTYPAVSDVVEVTITSD